MFRKLFVVFQEYVVVFALVGHRREIIKVNCIENKLSYLKAKLETIFPL